MRVGVFAALLFALVHLNGAHAAPLSPDKVPEPLKPWIQWSLRGNEEAACPFLHGAPRNTRCAWPARLHVVLDDKGARFSQSWRLHVEQWVPLPGDAARWPQDVKVGGSAAAVTLHDGAPSILLPRGDHSVSGGFTWDSVPESLALPKEVGLVSLSIKGKEVESPERDAEGTLWLQRSPTAVEGERLDIVVHRKVTDEVPLLLTTRIELNVAGKNREVLLGKALPTGFIPLSVSSPLPARVEPDARVKVQLRPGRWTLELVARSSGPVKELTRPAPEGPWRENEEVWSFEARPSLRLVNVEGIAAIDPAQTMMPDEWKNLPAYPLSVGETLKLVEQRRGDAEPAPDQLSLSRTLWLDFNGEGYTVSDTVTGQLLRAWRLETGERLNLGRVAVGGQNVFITRRDKDSAPGVELRQGAVQLNADSRIEGQVRNIPAVGWAHDFQSVTATLKLPPGWRLFHVTGVDDVGETWVAGWTLLDIFLVLVTALAVWRLFGLTWGVIAVIALVLLFPEEDAPKWIWLAVLAGEALLRLVPQGLLHKILSVYRVLALVVLALVAVHFVVEHVRRAMYPALERSSEIMSTVALGGRVANALELEPQAQAPSPMEDIESEEMGAGGRMEQKLEAADEAPSRNQYKRKGLAKSRAALQSLNFYEYDADAMVQTGPGLPSWNWNTVALTWSGPVEQSQRLGLMLISPTLQRVLAFLRVALLGLLFLCLVRLPQRWKGLLPGGSAAALAAFLVVGVGSQAQAQMPSKDMLEELRARLLEAPSCAPDCASISRMMLEAQPQALRLRMEASVAALTAIPLPGKAGLWVPEQVLVDGQPAPGLLRTPDGLLWLEVKPGVHQVVVEGALPPKESMGLPLPLRPRRVDAWLEGWTLEGLHEDGLSDDNLQLTRIRKAEEKGSFQANALPPFVRVERTLRMGLNWQAETRVVRVSPSGTAIVVEVPLLPGESVTSAEVRVMNGKALVNLGPSQEELSWNSVLQPTTSMKLTAPKSLSWMEVWRLDLGPIWHVELEGIPSVHAQNPGGMRVPEWHPWPGEEVILNLTRPAGVPGQTLTLDRSVLLVRPGARSTDTTLTLGMRSSRGGQHTVILPEDAQLQSVSLGGQVQPIRQQGRKVSLPTSPGNQQAVLNWRQSTGISSFFKTPEVDVGVPSVNAELHLEVPQDRWVLFAGGPRLGPAVLFWSIILALFLIAAALGRVTLTPLRSWQWLFLGLGLTQVPLFLSVFVVGWLVALGWRKDKLPALNLPPAAFNLAQLALVGWTLLALGILAGGIYQGLLGTPDMQIAGNGSSSEFLRWYQDRSGNQLPRSWTLSVPLLVYRAAMLAWALWLALSILSWLKWGWSAFISGGAWRELSEPVKPKPSSPPPPSGPPAPLSGGTTP